MKVTQSCLTFWDPMDCSLQGSSVLGILQARILEWVAIPFSRVSSQPRNQTQFSCIDSGFYTFWGTREALSIPPKRILWLLWLLSSQQCLEDKRDKKVNTVMRKLFKANLENDNFSGYLQFNIFLPCHRILCEISIYFYIPYSLWNSSLGDKSDVYEVKSTGFSFLGICGSKLIANY